MLLAIFLPLLISWIFKRIGSQKTFLTYLISGLVVLLLPIVLRLMVAFYALSASGSPDLSAMAFNWMNYLTSTALNLVITLFFQYIFNKTFGLSVKI